MTPPTHEVENQPGPPPARDLFASDRGLADHAGPLREAAAFGARLGSEEMRAAGRAAERHGPELHRFDRAGRRIDSVEFHPAYHALMAAGLEAGYAATAWDGRGSHAGHAAMVYMLSQVEPGVCCPMTMSYAAVPALGADDALSAAWRPGLLARRYDARDIAAAGKAGLTMGMAMTEKQGGSDVRTNTTRAEPCAEGYRLTGHKWFCSAPMSDGFLTLAQAPGGLTCFVVPRRLPDGSLNAVHLMRLKDKLGNRANASAEIEYHGALASRLGEEGRGVHTIIAMVHHTRLDTAMAPAGLMRAALVEALHWVEGRRAFQKRLIDQPLMRAVLAELALDWEAALALGLRVARTFDGTRPEDRALARIAVALAKFASNKRCPGVVYEAMEVMGGMGYVEDTPLPVLFRESPLNSIWEGSGNVIALDILRTLAEAPEAGAALRDELAAARGAVGGYDAALADWEARWPRPPAEAEARAYAERTGALLSAAALIARAPAAVAEGYCLARLSARGESVAGTAGVDPAPILERLAPA